MGIVTCGGCGIKFDRSADGSVFIKGKWYMASCAETKLSKIQLDEYICKIFGLKTPGPTNNVLIKKYRDERGYSYEGMLNALKYFYEIQKHQSNKAEERVGIIPWVYEDAQEYFFRLQKRRERIGDHAIEEKEIEIKISVNEVPTETKTTKNKKSRQELDDLFDDEE